MTEEDPSTTKAALRIHLDAEMPTRAELDADLARVLEGRARRRRTAFTVAVPGAFAATAVVLFFVLRGPAPVPAQPAPPTPEEVFLSIADSADPSSALIIDFRIAQVSK